VVVVLVSTRRGEKHQAHARQLRLAFTPNIMILSRAVRTKTMPAVWLTRTQQRCTSQNLPATSVWTVTSELRNRFRGRDTHPQLFIKGSFLQDRRWWEAGESAFNACGRPRGEWRQGISSLDDITYANCLHASTP
jgi:hypothetical protein